MKETKKRKEKQIQNSTKKEIYNYYLLLNRGKNLKKINKIKKIN